MSKVWRSDYGKLRPSGYRSKFEEGVAAQLDKLGVLYEYEVCELGYYLEGNGKCAECGSEDIVSVHYYTPDFTLAMDRHLESKGKFSSKDRSKMIAVKKQHPNVVIYLLFMANNKLYPKSKTRYLDWAKANGFPASVRVIPKEWLKGLK